MLTLKYSKVNQAWFFMWNNIVLKILTNKGDMVDFLKTETQLTPTHVSELLVSGKTLGLDS